MSSIVYGGLDVHKDTIAFCIINTGSGEILEDKLPNDPDRLAKAVRNWKKLGELHLCYEASGAGFVIKRLMDKLGVHCEVIAPSLIPKAPGDRVKTDKRDARKLANLYRAGLLKSVRVPDPEEETVRTLVRLHDQVTKDMTRVKNRVTKYLGSLGHYFRNGDTWTQKHQAWLKGVPLDEIQRMIVDTHLKQLAEFGNQRKIIDQKIAELAQSERYQEGVARLVCFRGIDVYSAMLLLTEIGDAQRFGRAPHLMSYFGLVPREVSSGGTHHRGKITKAGSSRARWVLTEAAWCQIRKPGSSMRAMKVRESQPAEVVAIAEKAEKRLHSKFWSVALRKDRRTAAIAVAREMTGFIWAILRVEIRAEKAAA